MTVAKPNNILLNETHRLVAHGALMVFPMTFQFRICGFMSAL